MTELKEKVLVTGAGGFIGSHLVEALLDKGYDVTCLLKPGEDNRWIKDLDVTTIYGDITDKGALHEPVKEVSNIYHLAATTGKTLSASDIDKINNEGTKNLVDVCLDSGTKIKRFLFTSSIAAVGETGESGYFNEESTPNPRSHYGKSKLAAEKYLRENGDKLPFTIIRLPLVYGPRNFHDIHTLFKLANKGLRLVLSNASTSVGFVNDMVKGMILAAENPAAAGQTYFLGEEEAYSHPELTRHVADGVGRKTIKIRIPYFIQYIIAIFAEAVGALKGTRPLVQRRSLRDFLTANWRFSMEKAKEELNFKVEYPLPRGAKITADWYKKNGFI